MARRAWPEAWALRPEAWALIRLALSFPARVRETELAALPARSQPAPAGWSRQIPHSQPANPASAARPGIAMRRSHLYANRSGSAPALLAPRHRQSCGAALPPAACLVE